MFFIEENAYAVQSSPWFRNEQKSSRWKTFLLRSLKALTTCFLFFTWLCPWTPMESITDNDCLIIFTLPIASFIFSIADLGKHWPLWEGLYLFNNFIVSCLMLWYSPLFSSYCLIFDILSWLLLVILFYRLD